jgi:hypothetical protein
MKMRIQEEMKDVMLDRNVKRLKLRQLQLDVFEKEQSLANRGNIVAPSVPSLDIPYPPVLPSGSDLQVQDPNKDQHQEKPVDNNQQDKTVVTSAEDRNTDVQGTVRNIQPQPLEKVDVEEKETELEKSLKAKHDDDMDIDIPDVTEPSRFAHSLPTPSFSSQDEGSSDPASSDDFDLQKYNQVPLNERLIMFVQRYHEVVDLCIATGQHVYERYDHRNFYDYVGLSRAYPKAFEKMCRYYEFNYKIGLGVTQTFILKWFRNKLDSAYFNEQLRSITQYMVNIFLNEQHFEQDFWKKF